MAEKLFPMYCGLSAISGMHAEREICDQMLKTSTTNERSIALININGRHEWIYGQCNFKHEKDHVANFKFSNTFDAIKAQSVFATLINKHGVDRLLFDDPALLSTVSKDPVTRRYAKMCVLLERENFRYSRPTASIERSGLKQIIGRLFGGSQKH